MERARVEERSILRTWLMRTTIHLIPTEDYGWMAPLFAERIQDAARRRLSALGVDDRVRDRALAAVRRELAVRGELLRSETVEVAERSGFEVTPETRTHLVVLLVASGDACVGPGRGRESALVATREWIGEPERRGREASLAELARRYFAAFAPAGERDLSFWSGLPLRECRVGIEAIARELDELPGPGETLLAPKRFTARAPRSPVVRLLSAFDTYLMGYASRAHALDAAGERRVLPGGGVLRPSVCVDGKLVGVWSSRRDGRRLRVAVEPFGNLNPALLDAIQAEVADVGRFEEVEATLA